MANLPKIVLLKSLLWCLMAMAVCILVFSGLAVLVIGGIVAGVSMLIPDPGLAALVTATLLVTVPLVMVFGTWWWVDNLPKLRERYADQQRKNQNVRQSKR